MQCALQESTHLCLCPLRPSPLLSLSAQVAQQRAVGARQPRRQHARHPRQMLQAPQAAGRVQGAVSCSWSAAGTLVPAPCCGTCRRKGVDGGWGRMETQTSRVHKRTHTHTEADGSSVNRTPGLEKRHVALAYACMNACLQKVEQAQAHAHAHLLMAAVTAGRSKPISHSWSMACDSAMVWEAGAPYTCTPQVARMEGRRVLPAPAPAKKGTGGSLRPAPASWGNRLRQRLRDGPTPL